MTGQEAVRRIEEIYAVLPWVERRRLAKSKAAVLELIAFGNAACQSERVRAFLQQLETAYQRSYAASAAKLRLEYPPELPITSHLDELRRAFCAAQVVIVCGATGSGKTTQLPKLALECGCGRAGRIGCTQPRRIAATSLAARFAQETGATLGVEVGCQIRFEDRTGPGSCVKFMTDGILLAETCRDPELRQYDCLILDEVHERSLNIDFLLGYLKNLLAKRQDLHLIIASATLEAAKFRDFFGAAELVEIPGRQFEIEDRFLEPYREEEL